MKIKDFNEKVRIGTKVIYRNKVRIVEDYDRMKHIAIFGNGIEVRCTEFELYEGNNSDINDVVQKPKRGRPIKPLMVICPNGEQIIFDSITEASKKLGVSCNSISQAIFKKRPNVKGYKFARIN